MVETAIEGLLKKADGCMKIAEEHSSLRDTDHKIEGLYNGIKALHYENLAIIQALGEQKLELDYIKKICGGV